MTRILRVAAAPMGPNQRSDFGAHRQPAQYGPITGRAGVVEPA